MLLTNESVIKALESRGINASLQKETGQVFIQKTIEGVDFPFFLRILPSGPFLQCVSFIPCEVVEQDPKEFLSLLHVLNRRIDLSGFGFDETSRFCFLRYNIPCFKNELDLDTLVEILRRMEECLKSFAGILIAVAKDKNAYEEAKNALALNKS